MRFEFADYNAYEGRWGGGRGVECLFTTRISRGISWQGNEVGMATYHEA